MTISLETVLGFLSTRIEQDDLIKESRCSHNPEVHAQSIQLGQFSSKMAAHALKTSVDQLFCDEISRASSATLVSYPYSNLKHCTKLTTCSSIWYGTLTGSKAASQNSISSKINQQMNTDKLHKWYKLFLLIMVHIDDSNEVRGPQLCWGSEDNENPVGVWMSEPPAADRKLSPKVNPNLIYFTMKWNYEMNHI